MQPVDGLTMVACTASSCSAFTRDKSRRSRVNSLSRCARSDWTDSSATWRLECELTTVSRVEDSSALLARSSVSFSVINSTCSQTSIWILAWESRHTRNNVPSLKSPAVYEERMSRVGDFHWLGSVHWLSFVALTLLALNWSSDLTKILEFKIKILTSGHKINSKTSSQWLQTRSKTFRNWTWVFSRPGQEGNLSR